MQQAAELIRSRVFDGLATAGLLEGNERLAKSEFGEIDNAWVDERNGAD